MTWVTSRLSLFSVSNALTSPSRRYATTSTFYSGALSLFLSLSLAFNKGGGHDLLRSFSSFRLGIHIQRVYSAKPLLFACLRCILYVRLYCVFFVLYALYFARCNSFWPSWANLCSSVHAWWQLGELRTYLVLSSRGFMFGWEDTTASALHAFYCTTLPCFYNVLSANTLSRVCILQTKHCYVLLRWYVTGHNYMQIHIWRRDLVPFVCACEHLYRLWYQVAARPWGAEIQGLGFTYPA